MTRKDQLKTIIVDAQERELPEIWDRAADVPLDSGKIITLSGVRRSGKTYCLLRLIQRLRADGLETNHILYINFEDERIRLKEDELDTILQSYRELYPELNLSECFFFFDEIQEIEGWERFIARLYETVSRRVFITGSNARLLSREIATALRGRSVTYEIYPLSFSEYVGVVHPGLTPHKSADAAKLARAFGGFVKQGGFPETIKQAPGLREKILQEYFNVMVFRDLVERYEISRAQTLKYFCKRALGASGGEFSLNKIFNELKSQGYKVGKDTLYAWRDYIDDVYLCRFVNKYSDSTVKAENSRKKTYIIDAGLGAAMDYKFAEDRGRQLETTSALEFLKRGKQISYLQNGFECDFVVAEKGLVTQAIQIAEDISAPETLEREIKGLTLACARFGLREGTVITFDHAEQIQKNGVNITIVPAWKYFLFLGAEA
ncbi:MAG: ATP-binding protein [Synergistaceae bacterium]|jgi:predicted AAA+ superfamily ATPase|nr:ATP-binding protein [Synergistaceae bacterium]